MTINKRSALRRGVTAAVFAAGLAAGAPAAIAFADDPAATPSDTKDVYVFHGTTYDEFQTVDGTRTEVVTNGSVSSDFDLESAHGREVINDRTLASGEEITTERVGLYGTDNAGGPVTEFLHVHEVTPAP